MTEPAQSPETSAETTPDAPGADNSYYARIIAEYDKKVAASTNVDGWTGERQKRFLEAIADGETVRYACKMVALSPQSAYAYRRKPKGRAFDLGWKAADLLARERVAADLLCRAVEGQEVTITRADGSTVIRHHHDNRLALRMLDRLDRYADASERTAPGHAARLVAADFESYLDLVGAEGGPARAGLFMLARSYGTGADGEAPAAELEPIVALARADRHLRCGTRVEDVDVSDLDPARRAEWTADQWLRAEACGVVALAPTPQSEPEPEQPPAECQPVSTPAPPLADPLDEHVWFYDTEKQWRTDFPPPEDFIGVEEGDWSDDDYERELTEEEMELLGLEEPGGEEELARREAERDAWMAANAFNPAPQPVTAPSSADIVAD